MDAGTDEMLYEKIVKEIISILANIQLPIGIAHLCTNYST